MSDQSAVPSAWIRCQANPVFYLGVNQGGIIGGTVIPLAVGTTLANCFHIIPHLLKNFFLFQTPKNNFLFSLEVLQCPPPTWLPPVISISVSVPVSVPIPYLYLHLHLHLHLYLYLKSPDQGLSHQWQVLNSGLCALRTSTIYQWDSTSAPWISFILTWHLTKFLRMTLNLYSKLLEL